MTQSHKCLLRSWRALRYFSRGEERDERLIRRGCSPALRHPRDALGASHPQMGRPAPPPQGSLGIQEDNPRSPAFPMPMARALRVGEGMQ